MPPEAEVTIEQPAITGTPATTGAPAVENPAPAPENTNGDTPAGTNKENEEEHRVPKGVQKRIDRLTRERYRLQAENEVLRQQVQRTPATTSAPAPAADSPKPPKLDDYQTVEEYIDAVADFKASQLIEKKLGERDKSAQERSQHERQGKLVETYSKRVEEARAIYDDYDDVTDNPDIPISDAMAQAIMRSEMGADIAYFLGKNPDEAERLLTLDPYSVAIEIGKISAKISRPTRKTATSAPAPIDPVGARAAPVVDPDKMSTDDWLKWRNSQIKSRK